jgi:hypothetical protein
MRVPGDPCSENPYLLNGWMYKRGWEEIEEKIV